MAIVNLEVPFAEVHGTLARKGIVHRKKKYRDENGKVIFEGRQEAYSVRHPRNYKKKPPQGDELRNIDLFREANRLTTAILHAGAYTEEEVSAMSARKRKKIMELRSRYDAYKARFAKQVRRPDPQAPIDPKTRRRKQYRTLNTFIRALIYHALKA
ncbi:MAG: hypothetical protein J6Y00_00210 [Paludibacteraceae bacterium]|nr:hypothetical protein [Paludibacteraceae bacterium]